MPRTAQRIYLHQYLDVIDNQSQHLLGYLSDFSTEGMMFISRESFALPTEKTVCIVNNLTQPAIIIYAHITVVWQRPNLNPEMNCVGCRFIALDNYNRGLLEQMGREIGFADNIEVYREGIVTMNN